MSKMSVSEAAASLGVSPARVRQRIEEGSLIAEKVGGRWLVDLSVVPENRSRGRPVKPELLWDAIRRVDAADQLPRERGRQFEEVLRLVYGADAPRQVGSSYAPDLLLPSGEAVEVKVGQSSRRRALLRLLDVARSAGVQHEHSAAEALLRWLGDRAERRLYRVAPPDFNDLRDDVRILRSGLSHPRSGMQDPRVIEGYVAAADIKGLVEDYWLDPPGVDAAPNVFLHVAPGRPSEVSPLMLAADLSEHEGPRERARAIELVAEVFA
jgi:excisionase family DNA binding protein